jgi:hypothetical protein
MPLNKIINEIKKLTAYAEEDLDSGPVETLANRRGRKVNAIESIGRLKIQYVSQLLKNTVFLLTTGDKKDLLSMIAAEQFSVFNADPEEFYEGLVDQVPPILYSNKDSSSSLLDTLSRHIEDKALELDILGYPRIAFKQEYRRFLKNREEFKDLVIKMINEQMGSEIVGIQSVHSIAEEALARGHSAQITVIMLSTDNLQLLSDLKRDLPRLSANVFTVGAGKLNKEAKKIVGSSLSFNPKKDSDPSESAKELFVKIKSLLRK